MRVGLVGWVPRLVVGTGVVHLVYGGVQANAWGEIWRDGVVAAAAGADPGPREASVWYAVCGVALVGIGLLARWALRETGRLPAPLGWLLIALGAPLCVLYFPGSGGWLLLAVGVLALVAARRRT
ncbi:DUF6463 family protein [Kitasatospora sp. NPDC051170]|uniref:DUF6463 family protein n=1 Tax=Kitasatospora sp. NPDC051170 TaxID=3364056 RepID=UPI00378BEC44